MSKRSKAYSEIEHKLHEINDVIEGLNSLQLCALRAELAALSQTNCGWLMYRNRQLIERAIVENLAYRKRRAEESKRQPVAEGKHE